MGSPLGAAIGKKYLQEYVQFGFHSSIIKKEYEQGSIIFREKSTFLEKHRCALVLQGKVLITFLYWMIDLMRTRTTAGQGIILHSLVLQGKKVPLTYL